MFLILTRCKIPNSDDRLDPENLDDDEFGDVDLKQTEEEGELELVARVDPGRPQKAKFDQNGERIWKALLVEYDGEDLWYDTAAYSMTGIAAQKFFAFRWTDRLSHTVKTRIELALLSPKQR